jgi:serine/threonine protein kinase/TolB-like protein/Flp pilus assembly protein TadD
MTPERWQRVEELFHAALEREASQRAAFLDEACAGDPDLRRQVEALLAYDAEESSFLEAPAFEATGDWLAEDQDTSVVGQRMGPYQVTRELGRGGMGAVYLAERADDQYQKQVAIKLVKRGMDTDSILRRFRHEQQILANLDHPNIAKLLDGGTTEDGLSYFIMDYVDGLPIDKYCDTKKLSTMERLKLFRTVCSAVEYAHQHHVVHRDLKPSNILVTADGVPKLLDFGIAKVLHPELPSQTTGSTATALRPMTPEYASPEQVRGSAITPASDIYSLGVLLYELLTGHRPYRLHSLTPQEIEHVICEEEPKKPSTVIGRVEKAPDGDRARTLTPASVSETREGPPEKLRRCLAGDLDNMVLMALRKEPERRYASVGQFSEDIRRHLEGLPVIACKDTLSYRSAKFIRRNKAHIITSLLTAVILLVLIVAGRLLPAPGQRAVERPSESSAHLVIAVLPFKPISAQSRDPYLELGMADALITKLSRIRRLVVRPTSAVRKYTELEQDPVAAGREQGVEAVLDANVQELGDRIQVTVRLVSVKDGRALWTGAFETKSTDRFLLQNAIAEQITRALALKLTPEEKERLAKHDTQDATAYQLYQKGRYFWNRRTEDDLKEGIEYFRQAIDRDPNYALAYAGLADSYAVLGIFETLPSREAFSKAKEAALNALAIDDTLAEAYTSLACALQSYDWDWPGAERAYKRALALNPNYATAHHWYSNYLDALGRTEEALAEMQRAQALDPRSLIITSSIGLVLYHARRYDQAIEQYRKAIEMDRTFARAHWFLGLAYEQKAMFKEAVTEFQEATRFGISPFTIAALGHAYALSSRKGDAQQMLNQLIAMSKQRYISPYAIATVYLGLGEKEQALAWLEKAYEDRSEVFVWLKVEPLLDSLRSDPRFADLLRRIGFPS